MVSGMSAIIEPARIHQGVSAIQASPQPPDPSRNRMPHSAAAHPRRSAVRSFKFAGPAGQLEAVLNEGSADAPFAALVCHPHPLGGGSLHSKVVYHAMKVLNDLAWGFGGPVLRFNFRGAGLSQGKHDGCAESKDVEAGMDWLLREFRLPLVVAGFSFGAAMALRACGQPGEARRDVRALAALGLPVTAPGRDYEYSFLESLRIPKLFLSGDRDSFAFPEQLKEVVARAADPKRLVLLAGADHFFTGHLEPMQHALAGWLKELLP
jgi:alpha/beta superfamily hydrolase